MPEKHERVSVVIKVLQTCFIIHCGDIASLKSNLSSHQERKEELLKPRKDKNRKLKLQQIPTLCFQQLPFTQSFDSLTLKKKILSRGEEKEL